MRAAFPGVELGVVCTAQQAVVFHGHSALTRIHVADHWFTSREGGPRLLRLGRSAASQRALIAELRAVSYDASIDLYPYFPNRARAFERAGIPTRVGYDSGGGGPLLTHAKAWDDNRVHTAVQHVQLLRFWNADIPADPPRYDLPAVPAAERSAAERLLQSRGLTGTRFIVLHPGTGNALKAWPQSEWHALIELLVSQPDSPRIVITGAGPADRALASRLVSRHPTVVSLCDETSWGVLRHVIACAEAVVGTDSVATHLAAAHQIPSLSLMAAISDPMHWRPLGERADYLTAGVACAPCFRSRGCSHLSCIRTVTAAQAFAALEGAMGR
jgi:ADP-heptose:LPS heptosyltransferase